MLPPHNSIRGQQIYHTAGTFTQTSTLLVQRVSTVVVLCLQVIGYIYGQLRTADYRCTGISLQATKPVKTGKPLTSGVIKLDTGAHSSFGAFLVELLVPLVVTSPVASKEPN